MKPVIIQSSGGCCLQVMQGDEPFLSWSDKRQNWQILKVFRRNGGRGIIRAIQFATEQGGFDRDTLSKTLGSWDGAMFAPNPAADKITLANFRAARKGVSRNGGKPTRQKGAKERGEKSAPGTRQSRRPASRV